MRISRLGAFLALTLLAALAVWLALPRPVSYIDVAIGTALFAESVGLGLAAALPFDKAAVPLASIRTLVSGRSGAARRLALAFGAGALIGALVLAGLVFVIIPIEPAAAARLKLHLSDPWWMPPALATEASVLEELTFRLLLMTGII